MLHAEGAAADCVSLVLVLLVASPQRELVDEVEGDCALADAHLLGLEVGLVALADAADVLLQLAGLLVLLPVLLALELGRRVEHDVLDLVLDVLRPGRQPRHRVVVLDLLPAVSLRGFGHVRVLGAVNDDVLWHHPALELALLGVLPAAAEQARGLSAEVADLLLVSVDSAESVLGLDGVVLLLLSLLLLLGAALALLRHFFEVLVDLGEVALVE